MLVSVGFIGEPDDQRGCRSSWPGLMRTADVSTGEVCGSRKMHVVGTSTNYPIAESIIHLACQSLPLLSEALQQVRTSIPHEHWKADEKVSFQQGMK